MKIDLQLEKYLPKLQSKESKYFFDPVRRKWVQASSEELVRQLMIIYLSESGFSPALMAAEREIKLSGLKKRFDLLVMNRNSIPLILVECKSFETEISQTVWDQAARYNIILKCPWLCITNGTQTMVARIFHEDRKVEFLNAIPTADEVFQFQTEP